jgi:N-acetylated-alpha-linked acidic dipeptidase
MLAIILAAVALTDPRTLSDAANAVAEPRSLAAYHELLGSEPHVSGTAGDLRQIDRLAKAFGEMGLEVEIHRFAPLLARPIEASLEIVSGEAPPAESGRRGVLMLDLRERNLLEDPSTAHPDLTYGWNAYSGSGDVTAGVVYANYGTREDFARLKEWGIDCRGKIVLARYGGNFRGYKAKFAEEAGAAGVIIFTDPADSGSAKGSTWPEGGWANDTCVQRGSILTLPWPGDPLTPGREATRDAKREDPESIALPRIPVQPIGYAAAERILARMKGREVSEASWKGGIKQTYRLEGGDELRLRLVVRQERFVGETANVIATLRGATHPDEWVVVGCHHDAWGFGAADPLAGTMVLMESARAFAEAARSGVRPERSILFAAWGAEEFGIIGSTEWVESRRSAIERNAVMYVNLDMASMGEKLGIGGSPALIPTIVRAMGHAVSPFDGAAAIDEWTRGRKDAPPERGAFGDLGGGSDHVGFWCHAGVPSISLGAHGSAGNSYHSNYDTIAWYRKTVGDDYRSALLVTRMCNAVVAECANAPHWPDDPVSIVGEALRLARVAKQKAASAEARAGAEAVIAAFEGLETPARRARAALDALDGRDRPDVTDAIRAMRHAWLSDEGLVGRPWFRNVYAATDRASGYAPSMLPLLAEAIEDGDTTAIAVAVGRYQAVGRELGNRIARLTDVAGAASPGSR